MPGRKGRAYGNALGGYKKQPRINGRFASKGTPGAKISNKSRNKALRKKLIKGATITLATGAVVGAGYYAHRSGFDKKLVKAPSTKLTAKYAKGISGPLASSVINAKITQLGPNRYTVQKGVNASKEIYANVKKTNALAKRARNVSKIRKVKALESAKYKADLLLAQRASTAGRLAHTQGSSKRAAPTRQELFDAFTAHINSPGELAKWRAEQNRIAGIKTRN